MQINIDENLVSGKSSETPTTSNNMTLPTEHNTTGNLTQGTDYEHMRFLPNNPYIEQQQHTIHSTSSPEIEIQHEIHNEEPITTSTTENRKNRTRAKLTDNVFFDISNIAESAKNYIMEVQGKYIIPRVIPTNHVEVNYTDKLLLPEDPKKIRGANIKILITNSKDLIEVVQHLHPLYHFIRIPENWLKLPPRETNSNNTNKNRRIPDNIDTIKAMIKESQPEKEVDLPITKCENIEQTIEILKTKFEFSHIPQLLVQLLELDIPEWDLKTDKTNVIQCPYLKNKKNAHWKTNKLTLLTHNS
ncbi:16441_t:CDS:2 [Gigaspora margarita]|uniref:16441_t:CDS:1 n=1 Tax=Gigaspora margarita TaxID=4874 RepID=A0ABM8W0I8_GIGMA|nr:16441_t:CDS:2 [Gigaspora margarita]